MNDLPIMELRKEIKDAVRTSCRILVRAPTGSGKSTQIPQILHSLPEIAKGQIIVLQPRRIAARMLAARVAREMGTELGDKVGYQIRMDNKSSPQTKILFATEGILLRRMMQDPLLKNVSAVLLDEFHERHLHGDIGLAKCMEMQEAGRPDLKIFVLSATLDQDSLLDYMGDHSVLLESEGRTFPVQSEFLEREPGDEPVWDLAARVVSREFHRTEGSALVFMPGAYEIRRTILSIQADLGAAAPVLALHGEMPPGEQDHAVAASGPKRIIVSTNVAETSLTIEGITLVVDSGLARNARYDSHRGINTLMIEKISRASAEQRAGRAGRTLPGRCIRLWTQRDHERRPMRELPEVKRLDLSEAVLSLKACGIADVSAFRWIDPPNSSALEKAESLLRDLGAIDPTGSITPTGKRMLAFPVHPRYSRMFIEAGRLGCVRTACLLAALAQGRSLLQRSDRKRSSDHDDILGGGNSDFGKLFRAFHFAKRNQFRSQPCRNIGVNSEAARQAANHFEQFCDIAEKVGLEIREAPASDEAIAQCLLAGFSDQVGRRRSAGAQIFDLPHSRSAILPLRSLAAEASLIVAAEIHEIGGRAGETKTELALASQIEPEWLAEIFPEDFTENREAVYDSSQRRVVIVFEKLFRDLVLSRSERDCEPGPVAATCLAEQVTAGNLKLNGWDQSVEQWIQRVNFLAAAMPELDLPAIGNEERMLLIAQLCEGAVAYRDIKDKPALPVVRTWLRVDQNHLLDRFAPEKISLPSGKNAKVLYGGQGYPKISARIQDLFGLQQHPSVAGGKVPVTLEILAPNHRPVQITQDLKSFWRETYPELKPALQRRYPKHQWN